MLREFTALFYNNIMMMMMMKYKYVLTSLYEKKSKKEKKTVKRKSSYVTNYCCNVCRIMTSNTFFKMLYIYVYVVYPAEYIWFLDVLFSAVVWYFSGSPTGTKVVEWFWFVIISLCIVQSNDGLIKKITLMQFIICTHKIIILNVCNEFIICTKVINP